MGEQLLQSWGFGGPKSDPFWTPPGRHFWGFHGKYTGFGPKRAQKGPKKGPFLGCFGGLGSLLDPFFGPLFEGCAKVP